MKQLPVVRCLLSVGILLCWNDSTAQRETSIELLAKANSELRNDAVSTEMILDMVDVWVADSILPRKTEHHHIPGGFMLPVVGIKWQRISEVKQKYVGTVVGFGVAERKLITENDVCFDVASHLPEYQQLAFEGYEVQKEIGRAKRKVDYSTAPFNSLPTEDNWQKYTLHCEVTPPRDQLGLLDSLFFPTHEGDSLHHHPNFGTVNRQVGLYGAFISDCNHTCHPEIHPYEWIWWLDLNQPDSIKKWYFGLFKEGSNRFPKWSNDEAVARFEMPFTFPVDADSGEIVVTDRDGDPMILFSGPTDYVFEYGKELDVGGTLSTLGEGFEGYNVSWMRNFDSPRDFTVDLIGYKDSFAGSITFRWW